MPGTPMSRTRSNLLLLLVALIWGSAFVAQALGMQGVGPLTFTALRFALGAAVIAPWTWREWRALQARGQAPGRRDLAQVGGLGLLLFLGAVMQQVGMLSTSVTNAGFLTALYVPLVPVLAWLMFRQAPHWSVWPAAFGCVAGTWLLAGVGSSTAAPGAMGTPAGGAWLGLNVGDLWVIGSSLPWALHVLLVGRIAHRMQGPLVVATGQFLICSALSLVAGLATEPWSLHGLNLALGAIVYTGVLSVGVGFTLQVIGQRHARPADSAIVLSSETVFAAIFGALFMGDRIDRAGLLGCALILACGLLVQLQPLWRAWRSAAAPR